MRFVNKVIIVTGASSGIRATAAVLFAKEGADVVIVGRNSNNLKNVKEQCAKLGKAPLVIKADVANDDDAKSIIKTTIDTYGKLDILVNNAGIARPGRILDGTILDGFDEVMNVNIRAVVVLTTLAAPHLVKTKGNIVNVSSISGCRASGDTRLPAYCTSKAALNHFTKLAAMEFASHGVRVNNVIPGPTKTNIIANSGFPPDCAGVQKASSALNRVLESEEVADVIAFLAADDAKGITGSDYIIDNGCLLKRGIII